MSSGSDFDRRSNGGSSLGSLLRKAASEASSLREMWARMAAMPYEDVQRLALHLADLLDEKIAANSLDPEALTARLPKLETTKTTTESALKISESSPTVYSSSNASSLLNDGKFEPRKLRLFTDGAARGNPGHAGAGAVLMLQNGEVVARLGKYLGIQTNNYAEYSALIMGLEAALKLGATQVECVADSQLMVYQIQGRYRVKDAHLKELYDRAKCLMAEFQSATIRHVLREFNKAADEMSNRAIDQRM